ncbi:MAG TPA: hypothetical protein VHE58_01755 [Burkholderiales bacterium]|nr:hypothetical protein [Burkholderiales bacterium]
MLRCKARDEGRSQDYDAEEGPRSVCTCEAVQRGAGQRSPSRSHVPRLHAPASTQQMGIFRANPDGAAAATR